MIYLSTAKAEGFRPMTLQAAVATFLNQLQPGPNILPPIVDDVRGKPIKIGSIRSMMSQMAGKAITTRLDETGQLVVYKSKGDTWNG